MPSGSGPNLSNARRRLGRPASVTEGEGPHAESVWAGLGLGGWISKFRPFCYEVRMELGPLGPFGPIVALGALAIGLVRFVLAGVCVMLLVIQ